MLCPHCRKLISRDERSCPYCGTPTIGARWLEAKSISQISNYLEPITGIIAVTSFYFIASLLVSQLITAESVGFLLSPSQTALFNLGASGTIPMDAYGRYWSLLAASFLHGNLLHIGFNMLALWQIGGFVLNIYGPGRFFIIYLMSGVLGFYVSYLAGIPFTIGASASICGLIGTVIYYGKSRGGFYGSMIYKQALGWVIGIAIFGFIIPGINNWAHGGGLLAGIALGFLLGYNEKSREGAWQRLTGAFLVLVSLAILCWALIKALLMIP